MIRVLLPPHLRSLARVPDEIQVEVAGPPTLAGVLAAVEDRYPVLQGTIREHGSLKRRPFVRFFACSKDISLEPGEYRLPDPVASGAEPLVILGAIAGG